MIPFSAIQQKTVINKVFTIYHSNQLDVLKDLLVELIRRDPQSNPLEDEQILVQSPGMAQWLRLALADGFGIAAATAFPLPASFLWDMFIKVLPDVPGRSAFNKEAMTWKIMTLLPEMIDRDSFADLRQYLKDDKDGVRLFQLSEKVADTFDQYLVYRPDWIAEWSKDRTTEGSSPDSVASEQPWQPELWRALVNKTESLGQNYWHRANMHHRFLEELYNGNHQHKLPKRLFVFGISALPPHFVETLKALGEQTDVHMLVCNPCRYYWGDEKDPKYLARMTAKQFTSDQLVHSLPAVSASRQDDFTREGLSPGNSLSDPNASGNPLLGSMGKLGRDYLHQLHDLNAPEISAFVDGNHNCLLHSLQNDILELREPADKQPVNPADQSLHVHSCHSPLREVEVLHDQLLALFEQNPELTPRDVVVMLPDVDQYSPWIQAVFGGVGSQNPDDPRRIPFSISDRSARNEHPILSGLLHLLDLDNSRCTAPELLELLEIPALQRQFELTADDLDTLRRWVDEAGIRWGLNPDHQAHFDLPPRESNSWLFGLRRLLLGYAMPEACGLYDNILPFEAVQGMSARLAGQLAEFIDHADHLAKTLGQDRSIEEWTAYIHDINERFFLADENDEYALKLVHESLENLHQQLNDAGYNEPLTRPVLLSYLTDRLSSQRSSQRFLAGQVNFCTLMPMRSIPFKVVCLLGLNDGAYPRSIAPTGFDLIARHTRRGDRSRREDDRYLFLEALLSAREKLYISYVGRSVKDNTERVPSVLVTELLDYIDQNYTINDLSIKHHLLTEHTLQPFSPGNFLPDRQSADNPLFSYAREWLPAARRDEINTTAFIDTALPEEKDRQDVLELSELLRFYRNPCKSFCNRRLKVFFEDSDEALEETEPFIIGGLDAYQLKLRVLDDLLEKGHTDDVYRTLKAVGWLPHGAFGDLLLEEQETGLADLSEQVKSRTRKPDGNEKEESVEVNLKLGELQLTGWLKNIYNNSLVRYRPAKVKGKDLMLTWIEHLCLCACSDQPAITHLLSIEKPIIYQVVEKEDALEQLQELIRQYQQGQKAPLAFFPETARSWVFADEAKAESAAYSAYEGGYNHDGERRDAYMSRCYPTLEPVYDAMTELAQTLMQPMQPYLEEVK
ncbi:exodeoxyribonuclease V subunit gamma [Endozoicomonas lisbonensis]|uniref:RecBCD enzyme subunit RecC n=1 Tax=Endozoicomonas lisbonensis TaxID=3120522 RepID=A0ABV2SMF3_9GAMM